MLNIEKEVLKAVNELKRGFDPKVKCSVYRIVKNRHNHIKKDDLNKVLLKMF